MYRSVSDRRRFASSGSARVSGLGNLTADALVKRASFGESVGFLQKLLSARPS